jgi:hypothetical protein
MFTKILKKIMKNLLLVSLSLALAMGFFMFHQTILAEEDTGGGQGPSQSEDEREDSEVGPEGQLPTFTQFFNSVMYEDGSDNPRKMSEIVQGDGAVLKAKNVFCDGTFKPVEDCSSLGDGSGGGSSASCPSGFTLISSSGNTLGCISTDRRKESIYQDALNDCFVNYGGRFPSYHEAYIALTNYNLTNEPAASDYEMVDEVFYDHYHTTAASATYTNGGITFNPTYSDFMPSHRYSIGSSGNLPSEAYHRCFIPSGNTSSSGGTGSGSVEIGTVNPNESVNLGPNTDYVNIEGVFLHGSDYPPAGGQVYKNGNSYFANIILASGRAEGEVTDGSSLCTGPSTALCVERSGEDLIVFTRGAVRVTYSAIEFGSDSSSGSTQSHWTESSGNVYRETGFVGIGVTGPNALLHLKTNTGTNAEIDIQSGAENHWAIYHDETSEDLRFWNEDVPGDQHALKIENDGDVHAQSLCIDGDCINDWSQAGSTAGVPPGTCIEANSDDLEDDQKIVINLDIDGENICKGSRGCSIDSWSVRDSDQGTNALNPRDMLPNGLFVSNITNDWLFDTGEQDEKTGHNGDTTTDKLYGEVGGNSNCELYDDDSTVPEIFSNRFVLHDKDGNDHCYVNICKK